MLARTAPNIYDILIAFFGGLVGVIAITRVEKGNPIPGVAIATALMPPLCTAGYGLATANWKFFLGAFYLYTINCVFICIATFLIVKYLKYPRARLADNKYEKKVTYIMTTLILIVMLPSIYFAYMLFQEKSFNQKIDAFVEKEFSGKGYTILYKKTTYNATPHVLELAFLSKKFSPPEVTRLTRKMKNSGITDTRLRIRQDTTDLKKDILNEIGTERSAVSKKDALIADLQNKIRQNEFDNKALLSEIRILYPDIEGIALANHKMTDSTQSKPVTVMLYRSKKDISNPQTLASWLEKRLGKEKVEVYRENADDPKKTASGSKDLKRHKKR